LIARRLAPNSPIRLTGNAISTSVKMGNYILYQIHFAHEADGILRSTDDKLNFNYLVRLLTTSHAVIDLAVIDWLDGTVVVDQRVSFVVGQLAKLLQLQIR
jgi:hypothetical protein